MSYPSVLHEWTQEALKLPDHLDKVRAWIKWAPKVDAKDKADMENFTNQLEDRVFGHA